MHRDMEQKWKNFGETSPAWGNAPNLPQTQKITHLFKRMPKSGVEAGKGLKLGLDSVRAWC